MIDEEIYDSYEKSKPIYKASLFWEEFIDLNKKQIKDDGYENFKQTVNWNYHQNKIRILSPYFLNLLLKTKKKELLSIVLRSRIKNVSRSPHMKSIYQRLIYKYFICMFYEYVKSIDSQKILERTYEPHEGNKIKISYKGQELSQDMLTSILEYYTMEEAAQISMRSSLCFAELGAGYGRLAFLIVNLLKHKDVKYCVFDIPPTLCVAQRYMTNVLPDEKIFRYRDFKRFSEVEKEFNESRVCFFLPDQLELIPDGKFDFFITISNLPEMRLEQINNYLKQIDRVCSGFYYNKQYWDHFNSPDGYRMRFIDYSIPTRWRIVLLRPFHILNDFFEAVHRVKKHE